MGTEIIECETIEKKGFPVLDIWLKNYREGKRIDVFFKDNFYYSVAIYGMGRLGEHVLCELKNSSINVKYGIDQNADKVFIDGIEVVRPIDIMKMNKVEAIIVTPLHYFNEIESNLAKLGYEGDILSIAQVVDYISK